MPQHMRRSNSSGTGRGGAHHLPNALASELAAAASDEQQG